MSRVARVVVYFTPSEKQSLRRRAAAHRVPMAAFLRAVAFGERPQTGVAAAADEWWDGLPPDRRAQLHAWLTTRHHQLHAPMPGQGRLLDPDRKGTAVEAV